MNLPQLRAPRRSLPTPIARHHVVVKVYARELDEVSGVAGLDSRPGSYSSGCGLDRHRGACQNTSQVGSYLQWQT